MSAHRREVARLTSSLHTHWVANKRRVHPRTYVIDIRTYEHVRREGVEPLLVHHLRVVTHPPEVYR